MESERSREILRLREATHAMCDADFGQEIAVFESPYPAPSAEAGGLGHPRVMLNEKMLPMLRLAMAQKENAAAVREYEALLALSHDGCLGEPYEHTNGKGSKGGLYNWDGRVLASIEAKALDYLLSGDELHGYEAILMIMNYIRTVRIEWIAGDQFREYGAVVYVAALVYDWCYPLLGENEKRRITLGVEHRLCRGYCGDPSRAMGGGVKMEMGCPPVRQGAITGHGNEATLLRDFLSFSIAIADEHPDWFRLVAGRIEHEYVPVREIYYASAYYPQGRYYAAFRFLFDLWAACLLVPIYGQNPYPEADMRRTMRSMIAEETDDGFTFSSGDASMTVLRGEISGCLVLASYLFRDGGLRAAAEYLETGVTRFDLGATGLSPVTALICASRGTKATDRHEGIPLIYRMRGYYNKFVSRTAFGDGNPVTLMKAGGRFTSNHEHADAGHFQIWYKGLLTGDTGLYQGYGSDNHVAFHMQSIAHNVPLVYNPAHRDPELILDENGRPTNRERYWYSGGQRHPNEVGTLEAWHDSRFLTADSPIMQSKTEGGRAIYSYISSEITRAYEPDTVSYLRRSMITSFETDRSVPMVFFVFDRIEAVDPTFKKSFLLQIQGEEAPTVSGNTVYTENGGGRLTLTSVTPATITAIGGVGQNYLINGVQCRPPREPAKTWGRVEISPIGERSTDHMLSVITVTDRGVDAPIAEAIETSRGAIGAYLAGSAAIFRASREDLGADIDFTLPEAAYTYFSGLNEGDFAVTDEAGKTVATFTVEENRNLAALHLPKGKLKLKKT